MAPTACRRAGSGSISLPCSGCFSPFPRGTGSLSVSRECLALPGGPGEFRQDYSCPALLRIPLSRTGEKRTGLSPSTASLSSDFCHRPSSILHGPITPLAPRRQRFGLRPVRSPLLGVSLLFSFPAGNEMFQFPAFACMIMHDRHLDGRVAPFGNPRVKGYLHLAVAYRGLSRPSSPPRA